MVVERAVLKPFWCVGRVMLLVMYGRMIFSSIFAMEESSVLGRFEEE